MQETPRLEIDLTRQVLTVIPSSGETRRFSVSTALRGAGELMDSNCTPRGRHVVVEKYGDGCAPNTVFVGRQPTGEIYSPPMRERHPERDWILTRILRLSGCESGVNRGGDVDSYRRYIYIHGSPDDVAMGIPGSAGCIRMRNADVVELFDLIPVGTEVLIRE